MAYFPMMINIEVLKDIEGNIRLAPLFDQGLSHLQAIII